jgi:quinol monooxygenase YgiN
MKLESGSAKVATISELADQDKKPASADLPADLKLPAIGTSGVLDQDVFESITNPGKLLLLVSWQDAAAAERLAADDTCRTQIASSPGPHHPRLRNA